VGIPPGEALATGPLLSLADGRPIEKGGGSGLAMLRTLVGGNPTRESASHGPTLEPCFARGPRSCPERRQASAHFRSGRVRTRWGMPVSVAAVR